jgi:hypothetical protein
MHHKIPITTLLPNSEIVYTDYEGSLVIKSLIGKSTGRKDYERLLPKVSLVGLHGWERLHSQGNITGHESRFGITYAPSEVNQKLQRLGIEEFIRQLLAIKPKDFELVLTTVTSTHKAYINRRTVETNRLKEIVYKIEAFNVKTKLPKTVFEAWIAVDDNKRNPRITYGVEEQISAGILYNRNPFV